MHVVDLRKLSLMQHLDVKDGPPHLNPAADPSRSNEGGEGLPSEGNPSAGLVAEGRATWPRPFSPVSAPVASRYQVRHQVLYEVL